MKLSHCVFLKAAVLAALFSLLITTAGCSKSFNEINTDKTKKPVISDAHMVSFVDENGVPRTHHP